MDRVLPQNARIGCRWCDWVGGLSQDADPDTWWNESELHNYQCPNCGVMALHEYVVPGSWPSDYPPGCPNQDFPEPGRQPG